MQPFISISGLTKMFTNRVTALDDFSLEVEANTFTVAMGPSGSGKSTLLYLIGGLDRPSSGEIVVGGQPIQALNENELALFRRQMVGFVFQSFHLIPSMTAVENVAFPMRFARVPRKERNGKAMELLKRVGLENRASHRPSELSGGQAQRVAIARSLVNDPSLILADEPTGNLDSASGVSIMELLSDLHHAGRTVLVVTHDSRMMRFATNSIYLIDGRRVTKEEFEQDSTPMSERL
jgi:putative ABC transport system ATP-binding protein